MEDLDTSLDAEGSKSVGLAGIKVAETNNLSIEQLQFKIGELATTEEGQSLRGAMAELKVALKQNPAACSLLLPENIGDMVAALKKMTNKEILEDLKPKKREGKGGKAKMPTQEEMDGLTDADLGLGPEDVE